MMYQAQPQTKRKSYTTAVLLASVVAGIMANSFIGEAFAQISEPIKEVIQAPSRNS